VGIESNSAGSFAERYQTVLVPVIFRPWANELICRLEPEAGDHVLDLACGTGIVTMEVAKLAFSPVSLTGIDFNPDMLAVARSNAETSGIVAEWVEASADDLPFPDNRFDIAYCQQALQFFPDRKGALRELRRVMKPGGRVAFCVQRELSCNPMLKSQAEALEKNVGPEAGHAVRAICSLHDSDEILQLFNDAGFGNIEIENVSLVLHHPDGREFAAGAMGGMHTGDKLSKTSETARQQCINDFLAGLGDCFDGTGIRFPHVSHVITARA
jgi:ubiquinone/menaquinone biosynthesis C-methylase UbiE